jgi:hypothetical protein
MEEFGLTRFNLKSPQPPVIPAQLLTEIVYEVNNYVNYFQCPFFISPVMDGRRGRAGF